MFDYGIPKLSDLLEREDFQRLIGFGQRRLYRDQHIIHERGAPNSHLNIVLAGGVSLYRIRQDGKIILSASVSSGQSFGDSNAVCGNPRAYHAVAVGPTEIQHYSREVLGSILDSQPRITKALYQVAAYQMVTALEVLDDIRLLPVPVRLGKMILRMSRAAGSAEIHCTQGELSQILGLSIGSIIQALVALSKEQLIETRYGGLFIPDVAALEDWVRQRDWD